MRYLVFKVLAAVLFLLSTGCAARAADAIPACPSGWLPVFFATDRMKVNDKNGKLFGYGNDRGFYDPEECGLTYGLYYVKHPDESVLSAENLQKRLPDALKLWNDLLEKPLTKPVKSDNAPEIPVMGPYPLDLAEFVKQVHAGTDKICLYTHGFAAKFPNNLIAAARLQAVIPDRVVLYSWPSRGSSSIEAYSVDECNSEWTLKHFIDLLAKLKQSDDGHKGTINFVAHSMGNRVMFWGLRDDLHPTDGNWKYHRFIMCSPDIDRGTAEGNGQLILQRTGLKITVMISEKDWPLIISRDIHGYTRLGRPTSPPLTLSYLRPLLPQFIYNRLPITHSVLPVADVSDNVKDLDIPVFGAVIDGVTNSVGAVVGQLGHVPVVGEFLPNKHSVFTNRPPELKDCKNPQILQGTEFLRFFDFTDMDFRRIGHTLPYPFVAHILADKPAEDSEQWRILRGYWKPDYKEPSNCTIYQIDKLIVVK